MPVHAAKIAHRTAVVMNDDTYEELVTFKLCAYECLHCAEYRIVLLIG
jgi:hypothetical protein